MPAPAVDVPPGEAALSPPLLTPAADYSKGFEPLSDLPQLGNMLQASTHDTQPVAVQRDARD